MTPIWKYREMDNTQQQYVEEFGLMFETIGINQTMGRIMGWLLIAEPPHQTLDEICEALDMSKSTISTTVRSMTQLGMIERVSLRGDRRHYYQINDAFWLDAFNRATQQMTGFHRMAEKGLKLLEAEPESRRQRLQDMYDLYAFLKREMPILVERWHAERKHIEEEP